MTRHALVGLGLGLALLVSGYALGTVVERRASSAALRAAEYQHQITARQLHALRDDARVVMLCAHIRKYTTQIPMMCR